MTQEQLFDSEATLRLVDRVLDDLDETDPFRSRAESAPACRTERLRPEAVEADPESTHFLRAFWEIHDAIELLRESHAALQPSLREPEPSGDPHDRLDRALAIVDLLPGEEHDPERDRAQAALRTELLALAEHLRSREAVTDRLNLTADLLLDLERRLSALAGRIAASS